jgi:pimeloyl-ACP methyl ester carboxylesterase
MPVFLVLDWAQHAPLPILCLLGSGYGFSSAPKERGCGVTEMAAVVDALMISLGYNKYLAQGGDWGSIICRALAK